MRTKLLVLLVLSILIISLVGASEKSLKPETTSGESKSIIYPLGDSTAQLFILEQNDRTTTIRQNIPSQPSLPKSNGTILDIPTNDDCSNAIEINEVENLPFNSFDATVDGGIFSSLPNVWFLYTATETGEMEAFVQDSSFTSVGEIAVYDGSVCPEKTVFPDAIEQNGGETIESAVAITESLPLKYTGTLQGFSRDYNFSCLRYNSSKPDVVYSYTANTDDIITAILITPDASVDASLIIMDGDGAELAYSKFCNYYGGEGIFGKAALNFEVVAGETYYLVIVGSISGTDGNYELMIYSPDYYMIDRKFSIYSYADVIFDAVAGHDYLIEMSFQEPGSLTVLSVGPAPERPVNDNCENATDAGVLEAPGTFQFTGDNTGATLECDYLSFEYDEVWIKFATDDTLDISLSYCNNPQIERFLTVSNLLSDECPCNYDEWFSVDDILSLDCPNMAGVLSWYQLPPGTYYYPMLTHYTYEGPYVLTLTTCVPQYCSDESVFGRGPSDPHSPYWDFILSDFEAGYFVADKFEDVAGTINRVTCWGLFTDPNDVSSGCEPTDPTPLQIVFCELNETSPYVPGDTVAVYDVSIPPELTGYTFTDNNIPQQKFIIELDEPVNMTDGWLMIKGNDGTNDCVFAWQNSETTGAAVQYDALSGQWSRAECSMAFCFEGQVGIDDEPVSLPYDVTLHQNYPNPFNATTSIQLSLDKTDYVTLSIYDITGRLIRSLHNGELSAGTHTIIWDGLNESGKQVSSGMYFYKLKTSDESFTKSMVLLK